MKIAQIAPPWITIPPKNYGGTEIVLYNLIEEQVSQGHDVTLFAPGDAETSAKLVSFFPRSLIDSGVPWHGHLKAYYHYHKAVEYIKSHQFDVVHTHLSSYWNLSPLRQLSLSIAGSHLIVWGPGWAMLINTIWIGFLQCRLLLSAKAPVQMCLTS